jgi:alpha-beta hydrolase superfamily lysophospholipase
VDWQDWLAATRLAVREAKRLTGKDVPLHIVGFSNGGALAMKYSLDALDNAELAKPQRVILISPMIGITSFARFSGLAGWPAFLPAFSKAAWLNIMPEFNPFKYNSFPTNAARQSFLLTKALQKQIVADSRNQRLNSLPPVLTFQSVMDSTVSTRAIVTALYNRLPENGSEIVLFDLNHAVRFNSLLRRTSYTALARLLPARRALIKPRSSLTPIQPVPIWKSAQHLPGKQTPQWRSCRECITCRTYSLSHVALPSR